MILIKKQPPWCFLNFALHKDISAAEKNGVTTGLIRNEEQVKYMLGTEM